MDSLRGVSDLFSGVAPEKPSLRDTSPGAESTRLENENGSSALSSSEGVFKNGN